MRAARRLSSVGLVTLMALNPAHLLAQGAPAAPGQIASGDQYGQPLHSQSVRAPFENRQCFQSPVGFDVLSGDQKIVGGALARQRGVTLYQGSIQTISADLAEPLLTAAFDHRLASVHV
jgi:hypothetical protein